MVTSSELLGAIVIVNHALCDMSVLLHADALRTGNHELVTALEQWLDKYNEVWDLEIALHRGRPQPTEPGSEVA